MNKIIIIAFSLIVLALLIGVYIYTGMRFASEAPVPSDEEIDESSMPATPLTEAERLEILDGLARPSQTEITEEERVEILEGLERPAESELTEEERAAILEGLRRN